VAAPCESCFVAGRVVVTGSELSGVRRDQPPPCVAVVLPLVARFSSSRRGAPARARPGRAWAWSRNRCFWGQRCRPGCKACSRLRRSVLLPLRWT